MSCSAPACGRSSPRTGSGLTREDVLDHCRQWLPGYMVPDIIEFRETLPRTSTGKVDRAGLTAEQHELEPAGDGTAGQQVADTRKEAAQVETVINDYISRELVRDPALLPLADERHCWTAASSIR